MRPALLAPYRHLDASGTTSRRVASGKGEYVVSLSAAVDGALRAVAPPACRARPSVNGVAGRAQRSEPRCGRRVGHAAVPLGCSSCGAHAETNAEAFQRDATRVRDALAVSGVLAGCDPKLPARFVRHAWWVVQKEKSQAARARIDALMIRLDEILRADYARSSAALMSKSLRATFGVAHRELFDFSACRAAEPAAPHGGLPPARRKRIETRSRCSLAGILHAAWKLTRGRAEFVFDAIGTALDAFLKRLPEMVAPAQGAARRGARSRWTYVDEVHDPIFDAMDEHASGRGPAVVPRFPRLHVERGCGRARCPDRKRCRPECR